MFRNTLTGTVRGMAKFNSSSTQRNLTRESICPCCVTRSSGLSRICSEQCMMYGSTLAGRSSDSEYSAVYRMMKHPNKWLARRWEDFKKQFPHFDPRFDLHLHELGALTPRPNGQAICCTRTINSPERNGGRTINRRQKHLGTFWPWADVEKLKPKSQEVPTTFRKLGRDATLRLIIEGYFKTREVLFCALAHEGPTVPCPSMFHSLIPE